MQQHDIVGINAIENRLTDIWQKIYQLTE